MVRFGIEAAHEQVNPRDLLEDVVMMDKHDIPRCWSSDHYMPWWHTGASGGAAWPWLGAALAKTGKIVVGTGVTAPTLRYNPAIVAQVFATLGYMFPGRTFLTLGTGESLNEVPATGSPWPPNEERFERMKEALLLIKKLWSENWVTFEGKYYKVKDSNLYTRPEKPIPLYVAALGKQAAKLAGQQADGFVTNELNPQLIEERLIPAIKEGAKEAGRDYDSLDKAIFIPASYDEDREKALQSLGFWKGSMIKAFFEIDYHDPRKIEESAQVVGNDMLDKMALVMSDAEEGVNKLEKYINLGFTDIVLINSSPERTKLVRLLADQIMPVFEDKIKERRENVTQAA
jgi:coenzyme F420-dependent glucose-6-phosphate dehydrogenase